MKKLCLALSFCLPSVASAGGVIHVVGGSTLIADTLASLQELLQQILASVA